MIITGKKFSKPEMSRVKNGDRILSNAPEKSPRKRLDHILVEQHPEFNRSTLQNFIKSGYVAVEGKIIQKPNTEIELIKDENGELLPPKISLNVPNRETPPDLTNLTIYEDENVLVLNKPAGMLSMAKGEYNLISANNSKIEKPIKLTMLSSKDVQNLTQPKSIFRLLEISNILPPFWLIQTVNHPKLFTKYLSPMASILY